LRTRSRPGGKVASSASFPVCGGEQDTRANLNHVAVAASVIKGPSVARTFSDSMYWIVPEDFQLTEDAGTK